MQPDRSPPRERRGTDLSIITDGLVPTLSSPPRERPDTMASFFGRTCSEGSDGLFPQKTPPEGSCSSYAFLQSSDRGSVGSDEPPEGLWSPTSDGLPPLQKTPPEGSWSPNQIAARARSVVEAGARRIGSVAGPKRAERQAVFGKAQEGRTLEGLARLWAEKRIGKRVVVMMGAEVSTGSGIPDIRDRESFLFTEMQRQHGARNPQDLLTKEKFLSDPGPLCSWLGGFLEIRTTAQPSASHFFLKILSQKGLLLRCYTQNIDGLEVAAGVPSERVVMVHGSLEKPLCGKCNAPADEIAFKRALRVGQIPQCCRCLGPVRPDLVFLNETTKIPREFQKDLDSCDLLLMMGTSLQLNPFSALAARVPALVPRVLLHHDKVFMAHCRHQSRQLDFDSVRAYRDLWLGGDCDETVRHLVSLLAWQNELQSLERNPGFLGPSSPKSPWSPPPDFTTSPVLSTVSSAQGRLHGSAKSDDEWSLSGCSSDGFKLSELSYDDPTSPTTPLSPLTECGSFSPRFSPKSDRFFSNARNKLPPPGPSSVLTTGYTAPVPDMNRAASAPDMYFKTSSSATVCTMISEVDEDSDSEMFQMQLVEHGTKLTI